VNPYEREPEGRKTPIVDERLIVPVSFKLDQERMIAEKFGTIFLFPGTLFWKEFNALTTSDGPCSLEVYQNDEDMRVAGDLVNVGESNKVQEFRALRKETKNCIPMLRASCAEFGEIYPIAAVRCDWGYLVIGGMQTKSTVEFKKLAVAVDNFCDYVRAPGA